MRTLSLALILALFGSQAAMACSDPVKHREHLLQEMKAAQAAQGQSGAQNAPVAKQDSLDDEKAFFGAVGKEGAAPESRRRR